jgi:hypothetical protein
MTAACSRLVKRSEWLLFDERALQLQVTEESMLICVMQLHFGDTDALSDVTRPHRLAAGLDMFAGDRDLSIRDHRFYVQ